MSDADKSWIVPMLVSLVGVFMAFLDQSAVNVGISSMMAVFNTNAAGIEWVSTAYMLTAAMVLPLSAWLGDRIGIKSLYLWCLVGFTAGSALCAAAWSIEALIAARVIQAIGGGMMMSTVMTMVWRLIPRDQLGFGMGIFGMTMIVAPAIAPTLGGLLVQYASWRWIFLINLPIGIMGGLLGLFFIPVFERQSGKKRLDIPGALTAAIGFAGLLFVLSKGSEWGWASEATVLGFTASLGLLVIFVLIELWSPEPLLDLKVFLVPSFSLAMIAATITVVGMFAALFYIPVFLQSVRGLGAMKTGMLMFPSALASGIVSPLSGKLYDRFGPRVLMLTGVLLMAATTWLISGISLDTGLGTITWWLILRGVAMGLMPIQTAAMADMPKALISRATAMLGIIRNLGASFGIAMMTVLLTQRRDFHAARMSDSLGPGNTGLQTWMAGNPGIGRALFQGLLSRQSFVLAIQDVFLLTTGFILMALIPAFFLKRRSDPNKAGGPAAAKEQA